MGTRICGDVLLVPIALKGHLNPMMYVAKMLMKRGLTMTMVISEDEASLMDSHMKGPDMDGFHLELVGSRKRRHHSSLLANSDNFGVACTPYFERILGVQQAGGEGPRCMIADQFMGWSQSWATKLKIPRYVSIVSPATFGYAMYMHSENIARGILEKEGDPEVHIPGIPTLHLDDLSGSARRYPEFITSSGDTFDESAGVLCNTFYDLEAVAIDSFNAQMRTKGAKEDKVFAIGPMLPPEFFSEGTFQGTATDVACIQWLDKRPAGSVVYVAFGSGQYLSQPQMLELANGLEASGESFLWVVLLQPDRNGKIPDIGSLLPSGFLKRTEDRGLVYPEFAPQLQILSHPATGGFVSHCGWNSTLESICRGVPMVGWPMGAEQKLCCRVVVDQAKVAVEVRHKLNNKAMVYAAEVEAALKVLMKEPKGQELKKNALELQKLARAAVGPDGSSTENLERLIDHIKSRDSRILKTQ
jgi:hypothetical protein